jgi:hypothetical protein
VVASALNRGLVLLTKLQNRTWFLSSNYLINNNNVIALADYSVRGEFVGEVLLIEKDKLTTLVGGKLGMSELVLTG